MVLSKPEYERMTAETRDQRMKWWREAKFGMFVHFGLYSVLGHHEWAQVEENFPPEEYALLANDFCPKEGAPREWAKLAKAAGMKYMVLTTRHHEGFSLWDSKANPFNSVNYGPHRDIVREFVDACREFGLRIGFYTSLMDWHHPDAFNAENDLEARARFLQYIKDLNTELLTNYGKIDILWYDVAAPMQSWEGWDSVNRNQFLRTLQPDIIINNRSRIDEDFGTPEERLVPGEKDWEACMTFNGLSWGYVNSESAVNYSYSAQRIMNMLNNVAENGGNLLLNIGPKPDGSIPEEVIKPLTSIGAWLKENGEAFYGVPRITKRIGGNGMTYESQNGNTVYLWNRVWSGSSEMGLGGYVNAPESITLLATGEKIDFEHKGHRIILKNLPKENPDKTIGVPVFKMVFNEEPDYRFASYYPQLNGGEDIAKGQRI